MAAIVTIPPVQLDSITSARMSAVEATFPFGNIQVPTEFAFNGDLYSIVVGSNNNVQAMKSTDSGQTWTHLDAAHEPTKFTAALAGFNTDYLSPFFNAATGIIIVGMLFHNNGDAVANGFPVYVPFDCNTETWGSRSAVSTNQASSTAQTVKFGILFSQLSGGDVYCYYTRNSDNGAFATVTLVYQKLSGGVWGAEVKVVDGDNTSLPEVCLLAVLPDSSDRTHVVYASFANGSSDVFVSYVQVSSTGVVGASSTIKEFATGTNCYSSKLIITGGNTLWIAVNPFNINPDAPQVHAFSGTPLAAPVWTDTQIDQGTIVAGARTQWVGACVGKDGNPQFFWTSEVSPQTVTDQMWLCSGTGGTSFALPVLFYDAVANPPSNPPTSQDVHTADIVQLANGTYSVISALEVGSPRSVCTGFALVGPLVNPPPPVVTPVSIPQGINVTRIPNPNVFDMCLVREYIRFKDIDYTRLQCGKRPECFDVDECVWGT